MNEKEHQYLDIIFKSVPLMSEFEKGRLLGYAEALGTIGPAGASGQQPLSPPGKMQSPQITDHADSDCKRVL